MTQAVLDFTLDLERIAELAVMLVIGSLLSTAVLHGAGRSRWRWV